MSSNNVKSLRGHFDSYMRFLKQPKLRNIGISFLWAIYIIIKVSSGAKVSIPYRKKYRAVQLEMVYRIKYLSSAILFIQLKLSC